MGVAKSVEFKNTGIWLEYWRMNGVSVDIEDNIATVRVGGYVSKADALLGKKAVDNLHYKFVGSDNPINITTDPREYQNLLYDKIIAPLGGGLLQNKLQGGTLVSDMPD